MHNLGVCYEAYGQYERSLESYKKSNEIKGNVLGQDHPLLAETYNNMGIVCKMMGKLDESLKAFESGLEILKKQNPAEDTSPIYADLHLNIASINMEQQQP
jgi:tetratricopeptide (TPR) repeat protein